MGQSVQDAWNRQREFWNGGVEFEAVLSDHPVAAAHGAHRRGDDGPAGVLK